MIKVITWRINIKEQVHVQQHNNWQLVLAYKMFEQVKLGRVRFAKWAVVKRKSYCKL